MRMRRTGSCAPDGSSDGDGGGVGSFGIGV
jgi:hypothetical protein